MKCRICGRETDIKIKSYNLAICQDCFLKRLWKRVGETIRRYAMFERGERVHILREGINAMSLADILGDMGFEFELIERFEDIPEGGILAVGNLLEDEVAHSLWCILNWDIADDISPVYQWRNVKVVKPLCLTIEEEIQIYRRIKGIEENIMEDSTIKRKLREKGLLNSGFWLAFYQSLVREKDALKI